MDVGGSFAARAFTRCAFFDALRVSSESVIDLTCGVLESRFAVKFTQLIAGFAACFTDVTEVT